MWDHIKVDTLHLLYLAIGGFLCLFMLFSAFIKDRLHFGEANIAILVGAILGPFAAKAVNPNVWSNFDTVVLEFSRVVIIIQCFVVALELPKSYIERHWKSLIWLVGPVVLWGWMVCSLLVWFMAPRLSFIQSMTIASCFNAIDPVMAATIVAKRGFAFRIPKHVRDLLLAESASNDVTTSVCLGLSILLTRFPGTARDLTRSLLVYTIIYQIFLAGVMGLIIGWAAQKALHYSYNHESMDRESFLVFYLMVALFCIGLGSLLGIDDVLMAFCAGYNFDKTDLWKQQTEESKVSDAINLLLNLTYFAFLGSLTPWSSFNRPDLSIVAWRLVIGTLLMFIFRRVPIILLFKPVIPDIKTWREALFYGHFGPIGVGAIFSAALISSEPGKTGIAGNLLKPVPGDAMQTSLWPLVTFVVLCSSIVHGSSIPLFTLAKQVNELTITISYSSANGDGPSWMNRLPRITTPSSSKRRTSEEIPDIPPGSLLPIGFPRHLLRRQREGDTRSNSDLLPPLRRRLRKWDAATQTVEGLSAKQAKGNKRGPVLAYQVGNTIIVEDEDGEVVKKYEIPASSRHFSRSDHNKTQPLKSILKNKNGSWLGLNKITKSDSTKDEDGPDDQDSDDDKHIRFQIGGGGRRLTKRDFIREIQSLDPKARLEILDPQEEGSGQAEVRQAAANVQEPQEMNETLLSSIDYLETGVERRRRLAVLGNLDVSNDDIPRKSNTDSYPETEVERRRRLAALGILDHSDTSEDEYEISDNGPWASGGLGEDQIEADSQDGNALEQASRVRDSLTPKISVELQYGIPRIVITPADHEAEVGGQKHSEM